MARGFRVIDGSLYYFKANGYIANNINNMFFDKEDGLNSDGQFANVTISGDCAFCEFIWKVVAHLGSESNINIPDKIDDIAVTGIRALAFAYTKTESVTIPSTVKTIGDATFGGCTILTNVTIPNSVNLISDHAFADCRDLTNITIPSSVSKMGNDIFLNRLSLTDAVIQNGITFLSSGVSASQITITA